jgi:hypothetical protein
MLIIAGCLDGQLPWLKEMARYAKQLAPKHLIISGTEGFFVPESGKNLYRMNPGGWQLSRSRHDVLLYRAAAANGAMTHGDQCTTSMYITPVHDAGGHVQR